MKKKFIAIGTTFYIKVEESLCNHLIIHLAIYIHINQHTFFWMR